MSPPAPFWLSCEYSPPSEACKRQRRTRAAGHRSASPRRAAPRPPRLALGKGTGTKSPAGSSENRPFSTSSRLSAPSTLTCQSLRAAAPAIFAAHDGLGLVGGLGEAARPAVGRPSAKAWVRVWRNGLCSKRRGRSASAGRRRGRIRNRRRARNYIRARARGGFAIAVGLARAASAANPRRRRDGRGRRRHWR